MSGDKYVAVHGVSWYPQGDHDDGLHEEFALDCTITLRISGVPRDRIGDEAYIKLLVGIEALARQIMVEIDKNYTAMNAASTLLVGWGQGSAGPLQVPLRWTGTEANPRLMDGSWAFAEPDAAAFLVMSVHFGRAHRHQVRSGRN